MLKERGLGENLFVYVQHCYKAGIRLLCDRCSAFYGGTHTFSCSVVYCQSENICLSLSLPNENFFLKTESIGCEGSVMHCELIIWYARMLSRVPQHPAVQSIGMAADEVKQTSEQQMRTLQFNDKVSRLNREFIRQLQEWYKQCAHYDFVSVSA